MCGHGSHDDQVVLRLGFGHPFNACGATGSWLVDDGDIPQVLLSSVSQQLCRCMKRAASGIGHHKRKGLGGILCVRAQGRGRQQGSKQQRTFHRRIPRKPG